MLVDHAVRRGAGTPRELRRASTRSTSPATAPATSRLSNHVTHRANIWALKQLGATRGDRLHGLRRRRPALELGSLVVFDDLHFLVQPAARRVSCARSSPSRAIPARAHWILHGGPFSRRRPRGARSRRRRPGTRPATAASTATSTARASTRRPRSRSSPPAASPRSARPAGPETVLCGELELPYALIGFVTDYANEVKPGEPTPVAS